MTDHNSPGTPAPTPAAARVPAPEASTDTDAFRHLLDFTRWLATAAVDLPEPVSIAAGRGRLWSDVGRSSAIVTVANPGDVDVWAARFGLPTSTATRDVELGLTFTETAGVVRGWHLAVRRVAADPARDVADAEPALLAEVLAAELAEQPADPDDAATGPDPRDNGHDPATPVAPAPAEAVA